MQLQVVCYWSDGGGVMGGASRYPDEGYVVFHIEASPELAEWLSEKHGTDKRGTYEYRRILNAQPIEETP